MVPEFRLNNFNPTYPEGKYSKAWTFVLTGEKPTHGSS
jgi:hypothetical protein